MMNTAIIGFGNAVLNYHLPYLAKQDHIRVKYIFRREEDREREGTEHEQWYPSVQFTTDMQDIYDDDDVDLVVICTHVDSHVGYAKEALHHNKHVLMEKPFTPTIDEAHEIFALAESKDLIAMANQNRRFDGDFLTLKKVLESGKLGNIIEIQSHYDYFMPHQVKQGNFMVLYMLAVHTIDQMVSIYGVPDDIHYDVRSIYFPGESDDYIDIDFFFGRTKVTIKCSLAVKIEHPKFIVHGDKGSFIKYSSGHQKKNPDGPTEISLEPEDRSNWGRLSYVDEEGLNQEEVVPSEVTNYGILYDKLYQAIYYKTEKPVKDEEVTTVLKILEDGLQAAKAAK
ncbi:Gfo/Idh/MocA family oxidoreductase [Salibacterium qingdaonense]|uniref:Predicted dehydrogenase n=1 Tax=Salibacterium qingdaonense TaxID=266892 RepID=A0A1I4NHX4_9BACI|nr:Gfo/Idh/MocA family oxidoreductase [Salibacterium qingdaonense]SFM15104.1 Predicted dehydrogenase [Salibacterium qingdaonense]